MPILSTVQALVIALMTSLVGVLVGAFIAWRAGRRRAAQEAREECLRFSVTTVQLEQRSVTAERELASCRACAADLSLKVDRLDAALRTEAERRATAEAGASMLPAVNAALAESRAALSDQQACVASLTTRLADEQRSAADKLVVVEHAQEQLAHAFQALSAEALKNNNEAFVVLAEATLAKFQETAKGDLDKRQQAIELVVKPVRDTLEKFDTKVQDLEKSRVGAYEGLSQQVRSLIETQAQLKTETATLV